MADLRSPVLGPQMLFGVGPVVQQGRGPGEVGARMLIPPHGSGRFTGPDGRFSVGALGVIVDDVLGWSMLTTLPPASWSVSTEIWLDITAPLPPPGDVRVQARTPQTGSYSVGEVLAPGGRVIAHARERGRVIEQDRSKLSFDPRPDLVPPGGQDVLEVFGLKVVADDTLRMTAAWVHQNPRAMMHGGVSFGASEVAATWSRARAGVHAGDVLGAHRVPSRDPHRQ